MKLEGMFWDKRRFTLASEVLWKIYYKMGPRKRNH